jgi:hypothetical protein
MRHRRTLVWLTIVGWAATAEAADFYSRRSTWADTLLASRAALRAAALTPKEQAEAGEIIWRQVERDFPVHCDWALQDCGRDFPRWFTAAGDDAIVKKMIGRVLEELGDRGSGSPSGDRQWLDLYVRVCEQRRALRLKPLLEKSPRIVFTKHETIRPSFFAYTEGQSDAQTERHFHPGSALCLLEMDGFYGRARTLLEDPTGAIRDPAVSWDARRVLFAWKKSLNEDDYHLYELELASGRLRQLTSGLGFADFEPAYLPTGDIVFSSTRCVQTVDCFKTEVSNLYTCDKDGRFLRRLGFDQVHTVYPTVTDDGRVIYTRWDYNDRGQIFPQGLFQMNADGTGQTALYGNNSFFPTTITHARGIPGTQKIIAIFCGHHSPQTGKLGILDPARGREENEGAQLIAPVRETKADRIDAYGQDGELFQYPFPLSETEFLVTCAPMGWGGGNRRERNARFSIYFTTLDGRRELLASDAALPCNQPVPLVARPTPHQRPSLVDYRETTGTYYLQDIHAGPGLAGVSRGAVKRLRVVALDFRAAFIGANGSSGPAGAAMISTPIAIGNGSWDVKVVFGDAQVHDDGSAFFTAPARMPLYFQALDEKGRALQTMRSWSTLQPGENQSCVGCHEHKNTAPPPAGPTRALRAGPQPLRPFYGPPRGFSFPKEIQPILDRKCVSCHHGRGGGDAPNLEGTGVVDLAAKREWSAAYLALTQSQPDEGQPANGKFSGRCDGPWVTWISSQSAPPMLPARSAGAARSGLLELLDRGHKGVTLTQEESDKLACWMDLLVPFCGDYTEAHAWTADEQRRYQHFLEKRRRMEAVERANIAEMLAGRAGATAAGVIARKPARGG